MDAHEEGTPLTPERMLALVDAQQRMVAARTASFVPWILAAWGVAWLGGFLALWWDATQHPADWRPGVPAGLAFAGLLVAAGVVSTVLSARAARGLRGTRESAAMGIAYGNTWWVGALALFVIGQALLRSGMPEPLLAVLYPSVYVFFAGIMYVMGGLIWKATPMMLLGGWCIVLSAVGALLSPPINHLVYALAGGGAFLLVAAWSAWWMRSSHRVLAADADRG